MSELKQSVAHLSVKSASPDGEKWMRLISTAPTLDRDGEIIDVASLRVPVKPKGWKYASDLTADDQIDLPFLLDHKWEVEKQLGSVRSMFVNADNELETVVGFTTLERGKDAHTLAKEGHLGNSFSGTFDYINAFTVDGIIYEAEMVELSMVFKGANRDARVLEVSKQVKKEGNMPLTKEELEAKKLQAKQLQDEIDDAEKPADPAPAPEPAPAPDPAPEADPPAPAEPAPKATKPKESTMQKPIAAKQVKDAPEVEVLPKAAAKTVSKKEQRKLFVKQFMAYQARDMKALEELNEKAFLADTRDEDERILQKKAIDFSDGASIYQTEVVSADVQEQYTNVGRVGQLVQRIDITGAETWKQIIQTAGNGFQPVGAEEEKQEDKPVWTHLSVEPKEHAMIVAWYDGMAKRTPLAVYQTIIRYIAKEYAKLEDKIILSFAGVTTGGGDVFAATGLVPQLLADGTQTVNVADFTADDVMAGLGRAYGLIESDGQLTLVANRQTWGMLAVSADSTGRPLFTVVGQQVTAGALGTFNVVISQEVGVGNVVMGDFDDYQLVTNGGLETLFSREATVGELNLFTSDASALRAAVDVAGKATHISSFALIDFVAGVS